ncbi:hypothetical protein CPB83DRAFT_641657 [Crepidotus variabilis]|uniref:TPR-like protein n=1 Tax=Crepidotus variabilis TaxID=179855 RepID=A0A9P6E7I7_9AGAR|nr:hypothetical protein CPB83DRAFT_641657 [Crepidotus variabilis]
MTDPSLIRDAEAIKAEGNMLYKQRKYKAAHRKFSLAIQLNSNDEIYLTNRAACSMAMQKHSDARVDAKRATEINPSYIKAWLWLSLASKALQEWEEAIVALQRLISLLPVPENDPQRRQYTSQLENARKALKKGSPRRMNIPDEPNDIKPPWVIAEEKMNLLRTKERVLSSGWVLWHAHRGIDELCMLTERQSGSNASWMGKPDALVDLCNGLMRDERVMMLHSPQLLSKLQSQILFQIFVYGCWDDLDVDDVKEKALQMIEVKGWTSTRDALSMTIRVWIVQGMLTSQQHDHSLALQHFSRVNEILTWGCTVWHDVPIKDRGCIFEWTFLRNAKLHYLSAIQLALRHDVEDCRFTVRQLLSLCRDLVTETDLHPPTGGIELDPGFYSSFWVYPKAYALSFMGWCYGENGKKATDASSACAAYSKSFDYFYQAAKTLPPDEDLIVPMLLEGLDNAYLANLPINKILPLINLMDQVDCEVYDFWGNIFDVPFRIKAIEGVIAFGDAFAQSRRAGRCTDRSIVKPKTMVRFSFILSSRSF